MPQILKINTAKQTLTYQSNSKKTPVIFSVSTSKNGLGQTENSFCTPLGKHQIFQKIGEGLAKNSILKARKFTGEIYHPKKDEEKFKHQNLILTRIIWLSGLEKGFNFGLGEDKFSGFNVDTKERFIYIHGTNHEHKIGTPASSGCIQMKCDDLIWLFDNVNEGDEVWIH